MISLYTVIPVVKCQIGLHQNALHLHIESVHEGIRKFVCDQCEKQFTQQIHLSRHIISVHEGVKFACDQCDKQFCDKFVLNRHIQSIHEGIKFACDLSGKQLKQQNSLYRHFQSVNEDTKVHFAIQSNLKSHIK